MDDLARELTGAHIKTPTEEAWHREQNRRKYDIIRVKNPTPSDFYVEYDTNQHQRFPANSTVDVPRYIAERYITHMKDHIIHTMAQEKHDKEMLERRKKGLPEFQSKYDEQHMTYEAANYPKTNDIALITPIIEELWVGLVYEFGKDRLPQEVDPRSGEVSLEPLEKQLIDKMRNKRVDAGNIEATPTSFVPMATPTNVVAPAPTVDFSSLNEKLDAREVEAD